MAPLGRLRGWLIPLSSTVVSPPSSATLDGKAAHSNNFLRCR